MTAEEKKRLAALVGMLDSDQVGEREAALGKVHALRGPLGWPGFADLWRRAEEAISKEDFEKLEQNLAHWMQAHADRVAEIAALTRRNAALAVRIAALRASFWYMVNWRKVTGAAVALALGYGGWSWWSGAQAAPDEKPAATATAETTPQTALDAALLDVLRRAPWRVGETSPVIVTLKDVPYWIVLRGKTDARSHADDRGRPIERHCLQLYASEATRDAGAFIAPAPYRFGLWMKWRQHAAECRMPGTRNYT